MGWVHPVMGVVTIGLVLWLGLMGLRSRHRGKYAKDARRQHRGASTAILVLFLVTASTGIASSTWLRPDLDPATSWHFVVACVASGLMLVLFLLGRLVPTTQWARRVHPLVGMATVAVVVALLTLGLGMLE